MALLSDIVKLKRELAGIAPKGRAHIIWVNEGQATEQARANYARLIQDVDKVHFVGFNPARTMQKEWDQAGGYPG